MIALALKLILAHIIGDFLLQPIAWVNDKQKNTYKSRYLYFHIGIHLALNLVFLGLELKYLWIILLIVSSHFLIDLAKLRYTNTKNTRLMFFVDQKLHFLVISLAVFISEPYSLNWTLIFSNKNLLLLIAMLITTLVTSILIKVLISPSKPHTGSLDNAGKYIGMLERTFVFFFVILNFWPGIGFLITAKSVFRFSDLSKSKDLKLTEYILIGTLLSFGIAIAVALAYIELKKHIG